MTAPPLWTPEHRRALGRLFDAQKPDLHRAASIARSLATSFAGELPSSHAGIDLLPLLVHKMAGYNCDLFTHACRLLRSVDAARAMLDRVTEPNIIFPFTDIYLAEHAFAELLRAKGGSFVALRDPVRDGIALQTRYTARSDTPGFERLEVDVDAPPPPRDIAGSVAPSPSPGGVLFIASMNNYLQPMVPVMAELLRRAIPVTLLSPRAAETWPQWRALPAGVSHIHLEDALTSDLIVLLERERRRTAVLWKEREAAVGARFSAEGVNLWPAVRRDVSTFVLDYFPYCSTLIELARRLADTLRPRACVVARLRRATESCLAASLRRAGVPVTMLVHGHITAFPERSFDTGSLDADRVCVWGESQRRQVLASPAPPAPDRVRVIGNPAWDALIAKRTHAPPRDDLRRRIADTLRLDPARLWAVYTAQYITTPQFPPVVDAFASEPRAALIIKPHPAEQPQWYRDRTGALANCRVLDDAGLNLHDLLRAADLTLTFSSTTNLESLILGTPVVTYTFGDLATQDRAAYLEEHALPLARTPADLAAILRAASPDPARWRTSLEPAIERALHALVGNYPGARGAHQAAEVILDAASRHQSAERAA